MSRPIDPNAIPGTEIAEVKKEKVTLKNVLFGKDGREDIEVEVVPFDPYNDAHVEFATAFVDCCGRMPSEFRNLNDVARAYVRIFMVHTKDDEVNPESKYRKVLDDLRASRTLFHQPNVAKALDDFFENV